VADSEWICGKCHPFMTNGPLPFVNRTDHECPEHGKCAHWRRGDYVPTYAGPSAFTHYLPMLSAEDMQYSPLTVPPDDPGLKAQIDELRIALRRAGKLTAALFIVSWLFAALIFVLGLTR
jgi:hypothetical protein